MTQGTAIMIACGIQQRQHDRVWFQMLRPVCLDSSKHTMVGGKRHVDGSMKFHTRKLMTISSNTSQRQ